jgi:hypothetical protein
VVHLPAKKKNNKNLWWIQLQGYVLYVQCRALQVLQGGVIWSKFLSKPSREWGLRCGKYVFTFFCRKSWMDECDWFIQFHTLCTGRWFDEYCPNFCWAQMEMWDLKLSLHLDIALWLYGCNRYVQNNYMIFILVGFIYMYMYIGWNNQGGEK